MRIAIDDRVDRRTSLAGAAVALLLALPLPSTGQESPVGPGSVDGIEVHVGVSGGALWTGDRLYAWSGETDGIPEFATVRLDAGPVAGLHLNARFPRLDLDAGLSLKRTFGVGGAVTSSTGCPEDLACALIFSPPIRHSFDAEVTVLSAHLDVRSLPTIWRIRPFLTGGVGRKFYGFDTESVPDSVSVPLPRDARGGTYRLGAGLSLPVRDFEAVVRVTEYLSGYVPPGEGSTTSPRHDRTLTLELLYRVR